jgi:ribosome-binding protein aMBF1 (putative translation factor)
MTPEQCRAGRGWLGWSQQELAVRARVGLSTVRDFEAKRRQPITNNIAAMQRALGTSGVRLVFGPSGEAAGIAWSDTDGPPITSGSGGDDE